MTQSQLYGEIANVTGETSATIAALGFSLIETPTRKKDHHDRPGARSRKRMRRRLKVRATPARKPRFVKPPTIAPTPRIAA